uniref:Uncharacterized protein n=1 Tax=Ditylenchus dipsaci TaxID=166011 RepID=A0A915D1U4_9BILA
MNGLTSFIQDFSAKKPVTFEKDFAKTKSSGPSKEAEILRTWPNGKVCSKYCGNDTICNFHRQMGYNLSVRDEYTKEHKCKYSCLTTINDYEFKKGEWIELNAPVQPPCDIIEVSASKTSRPPMGVFQTSTQMPVNQSTQKQAQESFEKQERKEKASVCTCLCLTLSLAQVSCDHCQKPCTC